VSEAAVPGGMRSRVGGARFLPDERLARRAVEGDQRAFATIYDRYHQGLYRFCLAIVGNPQDAQDALQNTMVKVLRALPGEQRRIELKPWLYRIAHNESVELLRRRRPAERLDPETMARGGDLAEGAELRERLRRLIADLDQLPERQRGALVMRELGGLDFAEIAAALGTSPAVARQTLYEARLGLREMDEGREMTCATVTRALSDADGRVTRRRDIRAHLRACPDCRRFREELAGRRGDLAALSPLPGVAAAGLLQGLLGGSGGSGAGVAGATGGAAAAKSLGATAAIKSAATVAVVAAIGVGVADRGGVIDIGPWGGGSSRPAPGDREASPATGLSQSSAGSGVAGGQSGSAAIQPAAALGANSHRGATGDNPAAPGPDPANAESTSAGANGSEGLHPNGRGHEKQHPAAASHGQQTAASHKAAGKGSSSQRHPDHPSKPAKPAHPAQSHKPAQPPKSASAGAGKGHSSQGAPADPGAAAQSQPGFPLHPPGPKDAPPDAGPG
jgi:RNA polymerase sigma factor (sigma-70 family)